MKRKTISRAECKVNFREQTKLNCVQMAEKNNFKL